MDEAHLMAALRYILRNPVAARLARRPQDWRWSSAAAYLKGRDDGLTDIGPLTRRYRDIASLLADTAPAAGLPAIRPDETIGRPLGEPEFVAALERRTRRDLQPGKRGPKPRKAN
jgi:putative transposase